ncbi:hypothetical protein ACI797_16750 [Geodermatophilus sp. SYSU D00691]
MTAGLLLGTAGCTSFAENSSDAEETTSASTTSSSPAETSESEEATTSASSTSASDDGVLDEEDEGRRLTLADFFAVTDFEERRYDVADQNDVQGIGATVQYCGGDPSYVQQLELRLANNFSELTFSAAQANDSRNSDQELAVEVVGNNEQIDIRSVPFNEVQDFTVDVEGVNALVIRLYLDDAAEDCGGSVIGVITDATLN